MHDHVILVTFHNGTQEIYGTFEKWSDAFRYRRDRLALSVKSAVIKPVRGVG